MHTNVVIIGGGISGISAAKSLKSKNVEFILLEKESHIGGHQLTINHNNNIVELGFIFGGANYKNLLNLVDKLGLEIEEHVITYSSTDADYNIMHSNLQDDTGIFNDEINRFYKIANCEDKKPPFWWWLVNLSQFLNYYSFSNDFKEYVVEPALCILFVTSSGAWDKPAAILVKMLCTWTRLEIKNKKNKLWRVKGGNMQLCDKIVSKYKIKQNIML